MSAVGITEVTEVQDRVVERYLIYNGDLKTFVDTTYYLGYMS